MNRAIIATTMLAAVMLAGCKTRTHLYGQPYESWHCENGLELHKPADKDFGLGIVRFDGTELSATYARQGLEHVWDWEKFEVHLGPSGFARYYDFTGIPEGERRKPSFVFDCSF